MLKSSFVPLVLFVLFVPLSPTGAQTESKQGTASISGRVTLSGKPVAGVKVALTESSNDSRQLIGMFKTLTAQKATTDDDGIYRFNGLAEGRYQVAPHARAFVIKNDNNRSVAVADGDEVKDIDFSLEKGGVITGRVATADGRPVIMESVSATHVGPQNADDQQTDYSAALENFSTDDRGVYRIYGLAPGRYRVSAGRMDSSNVFTGIQSANHPQTFHPGVTDAGRATVIELSSGAEATNVDIKLGLPGKVYSVVGKVVNASTNKPVANAIIVCSRIGEGREPSGLGGLGSATSASGEFRIEGLESGEYNAYAMFGFEGPSEFYTEPTRFTVAYADLSGVEIKAHRGSSISGVAIVEGTSDSAVLEKLHNAELFAMVVAVSSPNVSRAKINEDGTFRLSGLKPGRVSIVLPSLPSSSNLRITRIERDGVEQSSGIEVGSGEHITGVRLVLAQPSGVIRGTVRAETGSLPKNAEFSLSARRISETGSPGGSHDYESGEVDVSGRFSIDGLIPGEWEVTVHVVLNADTRATERDVRMARERVTVTANSTSEITLVVDLNRKTEKD